MQDDFGGVQHNIEGAKPRLPPLPPQIPLCDRRITPSHICNHSPSTMLNTYEFRSWHCAWGVVALISHSKANKQTNKQSHPKVPKRVLPGLQLIQPNKESHIYSTEPCHHKKEGNVPVNCLNCSKDAPVLWCRRVWFISAPGLLAHTLC